jgi:hypothetical protein
VSLGTTTHIATIYDHEVIMPLLLIVYNNLTPNIVFIIKLVAIVALGLCVFGCLASFEKIVVGFLKVEMYLFKRTPMPMVLFNPLIWWI